MSAIRIDGSQGEGGGQIVRTAAAMSACTGRAVEVHNARANRDSAGLRPQHVAALEAVAQACDGTLEGADVAATSFRLEPGRLSGGRVRVDTGTAACVGLILHALVPLSRGLEDPLELRARGGTDVRFAPTLDHVRRVFLPWARRLGIRVDILDVKEGFYPVGGGHITARIHPAQKPRIQAPLLDRGPLEELEVGVRIAELPDDIAKRIADTAVNELAEEGYEAASTIERVESDSPGVVVDAIATFESTVIGANALGEKGVPSETVARQCVQRLVPELSSTCTVDVHTADQLVPLMLGRGQAGYLTRKVTQHLRTNASVCQRFLDGDLRFEQGPGRCTRVLFGSA